MLKTTSDIRWATLRREMAAVEDGLRALYRGDCFEVASRSHRGHKHRLYPRIVVVRPGHNLLSITCTCPSGQYRGELEPIPCAHAASLARRLERSGWVRWDGGLWWLRNRAAERLGVA